MTLTTKASVKHQKPVEPCKPATRYYKRKGVLVAASSAQEADAIVASKKLLPAKVDRVKSAYCAKVKTRKEFRFCPLAQRWKEVKVIPSMQYDDALASEQKQEIARIILARQLRNKAQKEFVRRERERLGLPNK